MLKPHIAYAINNFFINTEQDLVARLTTDELKYLLYMAREYTSATPAHEPININAAQSTEAM